MVTAPHAAIAGTAGGMRGIGRRPRPFRRAPRSTGDARRKRGRRPGRNIAENRHHGRQPHDYRHDGGQCRRTGFPFAPAAGGDVVGLQQRRENILSLAGADDLKVARGCTPAPGDITIYVPWGNVAIFYKNGSRSNDLIRIGRIDGNGIEALSIPGSLSVRFERQRQETPENNSEQNPT